MPPEEAVHHPSLGHFDATRSRLCLPSYLLLWPAQEQLVAVEAQERELGAGLAQAA